MIATITAVTLTLNLILPEEETQKAKEVQGKTVQMNVS